LVVCWCRGGRLTLAGNGFRLGEGGDFQHYTSIEARMFKFTKKFDTKHLTATFAKPMLAAGYYSSLT